MVGGMSEAALRRKELSEKSKLKVVNATMLPALMYGCESVEAARVESSSHTEESPEKN